MIVDTHMHIFDKRYNGKVDEVINNAIKNNVKLMICVGYDYKSSLEAIELSEKYSFIFASVGVHPNECYQNSLDWVKELAKHPKVIAIGEIGLDYYRDRSEKELQNEYFKKQLNFACELNLPVIIHCREAINDCYEILKSNPTKGVLHCFSSSLEMANEFIKLGYYIGVGGVVTFSKTLKNVVSGIPLEYILSETDAPYLAPHPYRGKTNEPAYTAIVVDAISEIKNLDKEEVIKVLRHNVLNLFGI